MNSTRRGTKQRRLAGVAVLLLGLISMMVGFVGAAGTATATEPSAEKKVYVCKYVGTPGDDERLQTGDNPINVSVNSIQDYAGPGSWFNDQHGRSYVIGEGKGDPEPSVDDCPPPDGPDPVFTNSTGDVTDCSRKVVETIKTYYKAEYSLVGENWVLGDRQVIDTEVIGTRAATDEECPQGDTTRTVKRTVEGDPDCTTGEVPVYHQEAIVPVVDGVEGVPSEDEWATVETTYRGMTQAELAKCPKDQPKWVYVCKYVKTPGGDSEELMKNSPIRVSVNAVDFPAIGSEFSDAHSRSVVIAWDEGQTPPTIELCGDSEEPWEPDTDRKTRPAEGAPNCLTGKVPTWTEEQTRTETAEGVWGDWSGWTKVVGSDSTRNMTEAELDACEEPWSAETENAFQTITQPNCLDETIASWQEKRTRTETAEGVWGDWTAWAEVPNTRTTRDMTEDEADEFCPDGWVAGTEAQFRDVEAAFDCDVDPVPTWDETRTRTETAEGVWGEWTEWTLIPGSEGSRPVTAAEALSCAEVLPTEGTKPTPQGPKNPQGPKPVNAPTVLGVEAQAPAAVPTAVDAGLAPAVPAAASQGTTNLWMLVGGMLVALGMALGFVPMPARGRHGR